MYETQTGIRSRSAPPGSVTIELMRWMPPSNGISHAMMVPSEPNGGHVNDDDDQHAGNRPGEG
uniref:hypothetical protein n=1 Tax=Poseidonocella sp. HB161398 TaxID=2320855 RepID=UPI001109DAFA